MPPSVEYRSPLHNSPFAGNAPGQTRETALRDLALSHLMTPKLGVKGPGAEAWLHAQGVEVPPATYDTRGLQDGGLIARLGSSDFFLEGSSEQLTAAILPRLSAELARFPPQVYRVERLDVTILLAGQRATQVLAQLCSLNFRSAPPGRVCLTRVGGVNCTVLPHGGEAPLFRLWVDYTLAVAFWEILVEVSTEIKAS